jgi:hypothetical protein
MERSGHGSAGDDGSLHRFPDPPPPANGIGIQMLSPFHDFFCESLFMIFVGCVSALVLFLSWKIQSFPLNVKESLERKALSCSLE